MGKTNLKLKTTLAGICLTVAALPAVAGTLFIGTDTEEFNNAAGSYLFKVTVNGANFVSQQNIPLGFALNGLGDGPGFLYAGAPQTNTLNTVGYDGSLLTTTTAGFANTCCNEEMQFFGGKLYHAHWADNIQQIDPTTGAVLALFTQSDVVGMAQVGSDLWISHWGAREVGIWNPTTNTFTNKFNTPDNAGALAFDSSSNIIWVGQLGGMVIPYDVSGNQLNAGFNALAPLIAQGLTLDTVDGMTFQGESSQPVPGGQVPEPSVLALIGVGLLAAGIARHKK